MYKFYFNDCLPLNKSEHEIISCFLKILPEYKTIKTKYVSEVDGVVTSKLAEHIVLNKNNFTLKNCIEGIPNEKRELRKYAYAIFKKYPIEEYFIFKNEDDLIHNNYFITIDNIRYEALNLKVVQEYEGALFSLPLHDDLWKDSLLINDKNGKEYIVLNLFGETNNTQFIDEEIQKLITAKSGNFEELLSIIGNNSFSDRFKNSFEKSPVLIQKAIINQFTTARNRNGITPFYAEKEGYLIKDVTPEKTKSIKIFELKIYKPAAYRVYFYEAKERVYLGLVEKKPNKKTQDGHIKIAVSIIQQLVS